MDKRNIDADGRVKLKDLHAAYSAMEVNLLIAQGMEAEVMGQLVTTAITSILEVPVAALGFLDKDGNWLVVGQQDKLLLDAAVAEELASLLADNLAEQAFNNIGWLWLGDFPSAAGMVPEPLAKLSVRSLLVLPVRTISNSFGVMMVGKEVAQDYTLNQQLLVSTVVNQVAIALENRQLYEISQQEIAERKQVEEILVESEEKFRRMFEDSRSGMVLLDQEGRYTKVNKAMTEILGYSEQELLSMGPKDITYRGDITTDNLITKQLWTGESDGLSTEKRFLHKDGRVIWGAITVSPIRDSNGQTMYMLGQMQNITERKKTDQIKDEFIGMVSHELKTPLTVITGSLRVLANQGLSEKQTRELLQNAIDSTDVMTDIVENLLELSRSQAGQMVLNTEPTDVVKIAQDVAQELQSKSATHRLIVDSTSEQVIALADPVKVERILYNLMENAIKYSPKSGDVNVSAQRQDNQVIVEVSDQGIGISREDQSRLFRSFERIDAYQTHSIAGIGLGLRVCHLLVAALNGRIWVESEPGKGSSFFFTLPAADSDNQAGS